MLVIPLIGVPGTLRDQMPGVVLKKLTDQDEEHLRPHAAQGAADSFHSLRLAAPDENLCTNPLISYLLMLTMESRGKYVVIK